MSEELHWYDIVPSEWNISQGDIIFGCPIFTVKYPDTSDVNLEELYKDGGKFRPRIQRFRANVIVMTQACDLEVRPGEENPKVESVLVATLADVEQPLTNRKLNYLKEIASLRRPNLYLLRESNYIDLPMDYKIVEFNSLYTIPWRLLNDFVKLNGPRLRLREPYLSHLSQHFGRFFSRIGIPDDMKKTLDEYYDRIHQSQLTKS